MENGLSITSAYILINFQQSPLSPYSSVLLFFSDFHCSFLFSLSTMSRKVSKDYSFLFSSVLVSKVQICTYMYAYALYTVFSNSRFVLKLLLKSTLHYLDKYYIDYTNNRKYKFQGTRCT